MPYNNFVEFKTNFDLYEYYPKIIYKKLVGKTFTVKIQDQNIEKYILGIIDLVDGVNCSVKQSI